MTYIDDLIKKHCPNGVEWKELGEVCEVNKGKQLNKNLLTDGGQYPAYNGGKSYSGRTDSYNVEANTIIVSQGGASAGFVNFVDTRFWANAHCYYLLPNLKKVNNRYLYHFVKMNQNYLMEFQHGAGIPALRSDKLTKLKIPLPPLKIQQEIVKILDKFTEYVTELTAELTQRQKQYSFYRDNLLSFENEVWRAEWKTLGEVCEVYDGTHQTPQYTQAGIPFVSVENIKNLYATEKYISKEDYSKYKIRPLIDDVFMTRIGDIGTCTVVDRDDDLAYYVSLALLRPNKEILNSSYLKFFIESTRGRRELNRLILHNATPIKINKGDIGKIKIVIPPLDIQFRIVQVLDNFDTVCNDLNIGLPKEIELRQKQYEFFRDKLLTFTAEGVYTDSTVQTRPH